MILLTPFGPMSLILLYSTLLLGMTLPLLSSLMTPQSIFGTPSAAHIYPQSANYTFFGQSISPPMCFHAAKLYSMPFYIEDPHYTPVTTAQPSPSHCFNLGIRCSFAYRGLEALPKNTPQFTRNWITSYIGLRESLEVTPAKLPIYDQQPCYKTNKSLDLAPVWRSCLAPSAHALHSYLVTGFPLYDWSVPSPHLSGIYQYESPGAWNTPLYTTASGKNYSSLWRFFLAIHPSTVYTVLGSNVAKPVQTFSISSCVAAPYALLLGPVSFQVQNGHYTISCINCILTNCIDASMFPVDTILVVHQLPYVMLPVNISGPWYDEHSYSLFYKTQSLFLRCQKHFLGMLIAGIVAIVSVIASTATAAVSLTKSVNTAVYVNHLAINVSIAMGTQMSIDDKLEAKLNALEQTVTILGDKVYNLQNQLSLHCHAHYKYICVTSAPYNDSQ
uniref:Retroviral envelope protein GP41-like domain-containing protein n=1 Tax=Callithrix jacchus TaxID=9483 RepID=A0A8I3W061_CALJA